MKRWNRSFYYDPHARLAGVPDAALRATALPTLIVAGNDDVHPPGVSDALAALIPHARAILSPWSSEQWLDKFAMRVGGSVFDLYPLLTPALLDFIKRNEA